MVEAGSGSGIFEEATATDVFGFIKTGLLLVRVSRSRIVARGIVGGDAGEESASACRTL
ncbi:protein of unknown function [Georgfuchsia toluolica]|uniref:Uncharacterized protein n=1 Tax=Georgfuchsia toluolica TaxID=424218 RepID=A0A916J4D1_9PROT|nr:protein of unknown function [Georgfuchsia toluolica]